MTTPEDALPLAPLCAPCADREDRRCCGTGECWLCPLERIAAGSDPSALTALQQERDELRARLLEVLDAWNLGDGDRMHTAYYAARAVLAPKATQETPNV